MTQPAQADLDKLVRRSFLEGTTEFLESSNADLPGSIAHLTSVESHAKSKLARCSASYALSFLTHPSMKHVSRLLAHTGRKGYTYLDEAMPDALYRLFVTNRNVHVLAHMLTLHYDGGIAENLSVNVARIFAEFPNTFALAILKLKGQKDAERWLEGEPNSSSVLWDLVVHLEDHADLRSLLKRLSASKAREARLAADIVRYVLRHRDNVALASGRVD